MKIIEEAGPLGTLAEKVDYPERWMVLDVELMVAKGKLGELEPALGAESFEKQFGACENLEVGAVDWGRRGKRDMNGMFDEEVAAAEVADDCGGCLVRSSAVLEKYHVCQRGTGVLHEFDAEERGEPRALRG